MYNLVKVEYKSRRSNTYELRVRAMISLINNCSSLADFEGRFTSDLNNMPKESYAAPSAFYKIEGDEVNSVLNIWHLDSFGEKNRLVAIARRVEVTEEEFKQVNPFAFW